MNVCCIILSIYIESVPISCNQYCINEYSVDDKPCLLNITVNMGLAINLLSTVMWIVLDMSRLCQNAPN